MSEENVEIGKAAFETWNASDYGAFQELLDTDVVTRPPKDWPEPGPFVGRDATVRQFKQLRETLNDDDEAVPISDFVDIGNRVVVRWAWRGQGHGPAMDMEMSVITTIRDRRIVSMDFFWDHTEALEAAGLSE
jgi:ketosteroid isomerase-like protein